MWVLLALFLLLLLFFGLQMEDWYNCDWNSSPFTLTHHVVVCALRCGLLVNFFWMIAPDVCVQVVNAHKLIDFLDLTERWNEKDRRRGRDADTYWKGKYLWNACLMDRFIRATKISQCCVCCCCCWSRIVHVMSAECYGKLILLDNLTFLCFVDFFILRRIKTMLKLPDLLIRKSNNKKK